MRKSLLDYIVISALIHSVLLLGFSLTPEVNTSRGARIVLNIIERQQPPMIPPTSPKPLIPRPGVGATKNYPKIDIKDYADQLKAVVDPRWVAKIEPHKSKLNKIYEIIVLLSVDKYGTITNIRVSKSSGEAYLDQLAVSVFREIGSLPKPPEEVVKDGIIWSLVF